ASLPAVKKLFGLGSPTRCKMPQVCGKLLLRSCMNPSRLTRRCSGPAYERASSRPSVGGRGPLIAEPLGSSPLSISTYSKRLKNGGPRARHSKESKMPMKLYAHPFSSYCQKALIALYENDTSFEFRMLAPGDERAAAEHEALWPLKRIPVLVDEGRTVVEASIIIEHLGLHHPGPVRLIPEDPRAAL